MQQRLNAFVLLAGLGCAAAAQAQETASTSVQLYGRMDAGVEYLTNASANGGSMTRVISGGKNTSMWGVRGSEELGGGLKAVFNLEGGVLMDTGAQDGVLFKRRAEVGLEGAYGRLVLGRSFTTSYDYLIQFDPLGFAPNYSWSTSGSATGSSKYGMNTAFDNLIKYSVKSGDFSFGASYGAGEQTIASDGRKLNLGATARFGNLNTLLTWEQVNGTTVAATGRADKNTVWQLAGDYREGAWRIGAGTRLYKLVAGKAATADVKGDTTWLGVSYLSAPNVTWTGAVYHVNVKNVAAGQDADPTLLVGRFMYALSKRTDLYLSAAHASAKNGKLIGVSRDDPGFGSNQTGLTAGIQHRF